MRIDCHEAQRRLVLRLDGELPPSAAADLDAHLAGCDACRAEQAELRRLRELWRCLPVPESRPEDRARILLAARRRPSRWPAWVGAPAAAAAVLLVTLRLALPAGPVFPEGWAGVRPAYSVGELEATQAGQSPPLIHDFTVPRPF